MKERIGDRIKGLRKSNHLTQFQLAETLFVSDKTISKWEQNKSEPDIDLLIEIANIFNVSLDYLLTGAKNNLVIKGGSVVYNKDGSVNHYVGEDGDRLFTRNEVTEILKKRIKRHEQKLLNELGFNSLNELADVSNSFKTIKKVIDSQNSLEETNPKKE